MPTNTLGDFSGVKYDGTPDKFDLWKQNLTNKLTTHKVALCIEDPNYQGRDLNGKRVLPGKFLTDQRSDGTHLQTTVGHTSTRASLGTGWGGRSCPLLQGLQHGLGVIAWALPTQRSLFPTQPS